MTAETPLGAKEGKGDEIQELSPGKKVWARRFRSSAQERGRCGQEGSRGQPRKIEGAGKEVQELSPGKKKVWARRFKRSVPERRGMHQASN